ncbi:MAG: hypothetical protein L7F78_04835, partial [Syntrophales bacterium LBB04]|nr:hypothetical protein [Syntrophales bacterium LBB04]
MKRNLQSITVGWCVWTALAWAAPNLPAAGPSFNGLWHASILSDNTLDPDNFFPGSHKWQITLEKNSLSITQITETFGDAGQTLKECQKLPIKDHDFEGGTLQILTQQTDSSPAGVFYITGKYVIKLGPSGDTAEGNWQSVMDTGRNDPFKVRKRGTISLRRLNENDLAQSRADDGELKLDKSKAKQGAQADSPASETAGRTLTETQRAALRVMVEAEIQNTAQHIREQEQRVETRRKQAAGSPGVTTA